MLSGKEPVIHLLFSHNCPHFLAVFCGNAGSVSERLPSSCPSRLPTLPCRPQKTTMCCHPNITTRYTSYSPAKKLSSSWEGKPAWNSIMRIYYLCFTKCHQCFPRMLHPAHELGWAALPWAHYKIEICPLKKTVCRDHVLLSATSAKLCRHRMSPLHKTLQSVLNLLLYLRCGEINLEHCLHAWLEPWHLCAFPHSVLLRWVTITHLRWSELTSAAHVKNEYNKHWGELPTLIPNQNSPELWPSKTSCTQKAKALL